MSIFGETILSFSMELLVHKLVSEVIQLFGRHERIQGDLRKWEKLLVKIKAVLDDADEKQTANQSVKTWLVELENLAYDVEDILDELATEAWRRKLILEPAYYHPHQPITATSTGTGTSKFRKLIPTCCTKFSPPTVKLDSMIAKQISEITARFEQIARQKELLDLKENSDGKSRKEFKQQETTSLVMEAEVHGREEEKKSVVELLLKDDLRAEGGFSVIPITGMGGVGKTTLAQLVYNHETVATHFDLKAWACVSEDFDAAKVTKAILKSIRVKTEADDDLNSLQVKLKDGLSRKKFFIVLDDMWNQSYSDWTKLRLPFVVGAPGSKVIVTTRNQDVASMMGTVSAYELKKLSDDDCLPVFTQHSLGTSDFSTHQHLKELGELIVQKCDGLPLAAKTLGGLLRGKSNLSDWKNVLNNKIWGLPEKGGDIMRALRVSYHYLPAYLKRCFAHCSLLPKDYEFDEREIVFLWMAEGLLSPSANEKEMEELGHDYFQELLARSFFQQSSTGTSQFVMHDLINDLSQWAAGGTYFRMEGKQEGNQRQRLSKSFRHFSYIIGEYDGIRRLEAVSDSQVHLRTFLPMKLTYGCKHFLSNSVVHWLLKQQRLKVLSFNGYSIFEIPSSISDLKLLRHLDLSDTEIEILPNSVNTLFNLHTLLLENCRRLRKLCADIGNLIKLHHLNNSQVLSLEEMPLGINKLTCLQTLCYFVVGENTGSQLRQLKSLDNLHGMLKISGLENVLDISDAKEAELNGKKHLNVLFLEWTSSHGNTKEPEREMRVLDMLRPHENLKDLTVKGYGGTKFPIWLGRSTFRNLVLLRFESCGVCTSLPSVGQLPLLEHLSVIGMAVVKSVGPEFYGNSGSVSFPSLKALCFEDMQEWEDWIPHEFGREAEVFPKLQELSLKRCSKLLGRLPECLPSLERLVIQQCKQLLVSIPSAPTLCILEINECKKVVWGSSAIDLSLSSFNSFVCNSDMPNQMFLSGLIKQELPNLEELAICYTKEVTSLWQTGSCLQEDISSLRQLKISSCPQLVSIVVNEDEENGQLQQQEYQSRLQNLEVSWCQSLLKLPQALFSISSLQQIDISDCNSVVSLPDAALPSQLRAISITRCNALKCLPEVWMQHSSNSSLESLAIYSCNSLTFIARFQLPSSLKRMVIESCKNLRTLMDDEDLQVPVMEKEDINCGGSRYTCLLEHLVIKYCPSLTYLWSKKELPDTLEHLEVVLCSNLACLSLRGNLPKALKHLRINGCSELESIVKRLDNSTSLETVEIWDCENVKFLPDGLHKLQNLKELYVKCPNLVSFPEEGELPFKKLNVLCISGCEKLKSLPNRIHNLTSIQHLAILSCPSIEFFLRMAFPQTLLLFQFMI